MIAESCLTPVSVFQDLELEVQGCEKIQVPGEAEFDVLGMTLEHFQRLVDLLGFDESEISKLMNNILTIVTSKVIDLISTKLLNDYENEFESFDIKLSGTFRFGHQIKFFEYSYVFALGPVPCKFGFGAGGSFGVSVTADLALLSMTLTLKVTPQIGASVWGSVGLRIPFFSIEMKLIGYIVTTKLPTQAQLQFDHFPVDIKSRMDLVLVPLKLELRALVIFHINLLFKKIQKVVVDKLLWSYTTRQIEANIFNRGDLDPDRSPPTFTTVARGKDTFLSGDGKKRAPAHVTDCVVKQVPGRDHLDPAFELAIAVADEKSEVDLTFCVGSYKSGCDLVNNQPMGGPAVVIAQVLPGGVVTHFTVKATDSAGNMAMATCSLPTYDVTLPGGRVTPDFYSTSRPDVLRASAVVYDDSPLVSQKEGIGFGYGIFSDQIIPWNDVTTNAMTESVESQSDPLSRFTKDRLGRLGLSPLEVASYGRKSDCAAHCLRVPSNKCLSFNYDFGTSGRCELLPGIEGLEIDLHESGRFHYYEKLGVGRLLQLNHNDLDLRHRDVHYINIHAVNALGYDNIISSKPVIADFSPPEPGHIENEAMDKVSYEHCVDYVPDEWEFRCVYTTQLKNHRFIIDGPGSKTVFNGHKPSFDLKYTRANRYISANWDGYHDDETGIYGYTWTIGSEACLEDVHPHKDPHSHFFDESEWTHIGLANEFDEPELEDGPYHITVRAINKVDFGGPMATTVCHSMPYIIDRTPPIVHDIAILGYDEEDCVITAMYNLSDDLSLIKEISFGLGKSPRDIYLLDWEREANITHIAKPFCVPDGVPAWVKVRAMNHVELTTAGHAPSPIIVDRSPPIAGQVFDGTVIDHDIDFQSFSDKLCVSWSGFYDEDSGIEKYVWYAGTTAGSNDTVSPIELSHFEYRSCSADVDLEHNTTYYSTIVAFNAGHKNLWTNVTTDGVLYDETPPEAGWIKDGEDTEKDMIYSPLASTVSANWDDFSDPESGIDNYVISIWKTNPSEGSQVPQSIHDKESLPAVTRSIKWHHFHLHHGDYVYTEIEAVNKARSPTRIYSDGYTVDLTEPEFIFLGDGIISKVDEKFISSTSQVGVNWEFEDPESGLDHYKVTVYQTYGGKRKQFYPSDGSAQVIVDGTATSWQSPPVLHMINGGHYSVRVSAVNGAGIGNVQDTDGVIVDSTPPRMLKLKIGVLTAGEEEEIFDGYIIQSDTEGIRGYWEAIDFESDVAAYWISIGTYQGGADVKEMSNIGTSKGGYLSDLTLEKYDAHSDHPVYFVSIKAENGAGMMSDTLISRGIKVVSADKVGMVTDGPNDDVIDETKVMHVDVDYQRETGTVTAQFSGFESEQHGIVHYEWAIGTSPRSDEVQPFISDGIIKNEEIQIKGDGLGGSGKAQSLVPLDQSQRYYTTVRAYTGVGNVLDASSDGFTVDTTPPHISVDQSQQSNDSAIANEESSRFQKSAQFITSSWEITEDDSAILITEFCYGTVPGFSDIFNCTDTTEQDYIINTLVTPNTHSLPNTLTLRSTNKVGLKSEKYAVGVTIDHSPPVAGIIDCQSSIRTTDDVVCTWINFYDKESGISNYRFAFGLSEGDDSICPFTMVRSSHHEYRVKGPFETGKYFATVVAVNYLGDETYGYSEAIFVDDTPPVAGIVVELNDVDEINYDGHSNGDGSDIQGCGNFDSCMEVDAVCQKSVDRIFVAWEPFSDPDSSITRYQVAVGPSPGSTQILDFTDVDTSKGLFTLIRGINLYDVRQVFVAVRGYNQAGLHTTAVSNGVYISRVSSGLPPLPGSHVWDGSADEDLDYQDNNDVLHAKWSFEGDPCKKTKYEWAIYRFDGMLMQNFTTTSDEFGMNDGLDLKDGESYYTVVKATNELGFSEILRSNGITVQLEPLQPGNIRDGPIDGFDLNFQESITSLSANWDSFGVACGIDSIDQREPVFGQIIDHYEVAIGTDSRYASTRDDLHPFVDVGCNTTHTFSDLQLVPRTQVYYVTIRAYSISTAMAETTTNGIRVGYGGQQNFDASLKKTPYESEFDVYPWTNVGKDTMVEVTGLHLNHKDTYSVVVMATDESGQCSLSVEDFTVDLTPPIEGSVQIGAFGDEAVMYTDREDILTVTWRDFYDDESDIDTYAVALYDGMTCVGNVQPQILQDFIEVFANDTEYTFLDLTLKVNQPYYVHLRATNKAGLSTTLVSRPVFVDLREPVAGLIKDGGDFKVDVDYQSVTTVLEG
ncbi:uncharacterized protein [Ptychodera flava]|uniref:uncharacterized protein n=1 Tax=Ptychodera flava TaxID=63121 RepID=UPI00396A3E4C